MLRVQGLRCTTRISSIDGVVNGRRNEPDQYCIDRSGPPNLIQHNTLLYPVRVRRRLPDHHSACPYRIIHDTTLDNNLAMMLGSDCRAIYRLRRFAVGSDRRSGEPGRHEQSFLKAVLREWWFKSARSGISRTDDLGWVMCRTARTLPFH